MFKKSINLKDVAQERPGLNQLNPAQAYGWVAGYHNPFQLNYGPNDPLVLNSLETCFTQHPNDPQGLAECIKEVQRQNFSEYDLQYSDLDDNAKNQLIGYMKQFFQEKGVNNINPQDVMPT